MSRLLVFAYGVIAYSLFFVTYLYAVGFVGNFGVPKALDGTPTAPLGTALLINLGLLGLFAVQHSVMARPAFKRWWTRIVPEPIERSVYVLIASVVLALLMWQWRPIPMPALWHADAAWSVAIGWSTMVCGVAVLLWATFLINHFELFGLQQGWLTLRGAELRGPAFVTPYLYKIVRHPLYVGWLLIFWGAPAMTAGHLLFSAGMSGYILLAIRFEERDLVQHIGEPYQRYR